MYDTSKPEETVRSWFNDARTYKRGIGINLYFKPFSDAWERLSKPVIHRGVTTGLTEFEGSIYCRSYGPGDCECTLHFVGDTKY